MPRRNALSCSVTYRKYKGDGPLGKGRQMAKSVQAYSIDTELVTEIQRRSKAAGIPASRLVNSLLAASLRSGKAKS